MHKEQPVFFVANPERDEQFRIETRIWKKHDALLIEKRAASKRSVAHLLQMQTTHSELSGVKKLRSLINIAGVAQSSPTTLTFDYVDGDLAERVLLGHLLEENEEAVNEIVEHLLSVVDALPSTKKIPTDNPRFKQVFGSEFNQKTDCTDLGIIDLNLDNIIIDKDGTWWLFDYEWVFDFPVPKDLLRLRFLWYFVTRYKEILHHHAQRIESIELGNGIYIPKFFYEKYRALFDAIHRTAAAELRFQAFVKGQKAAAPVEETRPFAVREATTFIDGVERFAAAKKREATQNLEKEWQKRLDQHKQKIEELSKVITEIQSSKSYKIARKLATLKGKILK